MKKTQGTVIQKEINNLYSKILKLRHEPTDHNYYSAIHQVNHVSKKYLDLLEKIVSTISDDIPGTFPVD